MKKHRTHQLHLSAETIRNLSLHQLGRVAGGVKAETNTNAAGNCICETQMRCPTNDPLCPE